MKKNNTKKGFSLGEVVLAVFVLSVGIISVGGLIGASYRESADSRNQIIASSLAQEGSELVRNIRDNDMINGDNFETGNLPSGSIVYCVIDYDLDQADFKNSCKANEGEDNPYVLKIADSGFFGDSGTDTKFKRKIILNYRKYDPIALGEVVANANDAEKLIVQSIVWWGGSFPDGNCNTSSKCVMSESILSNL